MDCNNTLTDAELEAMFSKTYEEMRQIEQPMECPIEISQHKCKKWQILLQRICAQAAPLWPPIKKYKCPHCSKVINCAKNLEKHLRNCEEAPTHPAKQQLHQRMLDGPISSKHGSSTPKKLIVEEVQVDGAPTEHPEH